MRVRKAANDLSVTWHLAILAAVVLLAAVPSVAEGSVLGTWKGTIRIVANPNHVPIHPQTNRIVLRIRSLAIGRRDGTLSFQSSCPGTIKLLRHSARGYLFVYRTSSADRRCSSGDRILVRAVGRKLRVKDTFGAGIVARGTVRRS
jgi:hypothetical protein